MNDDENSSSGLPFPALSRTVTPPSDTHRDEQMDLIGWGIFAGLLILLMPLLPFILIVWLISKVTEALSPA